MEDRSHPYAVEVVVHGQVQGVFFRASTADEADRHAVRGWVSNQPGGTVRAHLEGDPADVGDVVTWMEAGGPPAAIVDRVEVTEVPSGGHDDFSVR